MAQRSQPIAVIHQGLTKCLTRRSPSGAGAAGADCTDPASVDGLHSLSGAVERPSELSWRWRAGADTAEPEGEGGRDDGSS